MPLTIPVSRNYPSPLTAIPSLMQDEPIEGRKQIPAEIIWGTAAGQMGGTTKTVAFNLQNNATLEFSQISTLKVDNSKCGADVQFIFPDTSEVLTIPAYCPLAVVPVFSNSKQFYVTALNSVNGDTTRFQALNYQLPPVDIPVSTGQSITSNGTFDFPMNAGGTALFVAATISGTITNVSIFASAIKMAAAGRQVGVLLDGGGNILWEVNVALAAVADDTRALNVLAASMGGLNIHFSGGLLFGSAAGGAVPVGGNWNVNVQYRTS